MNNITEPKKRSLNNKLFRAILFVVYPAYILHSLVVSPIYTVLYSDVAVNKIIPVLLYYFIVFIDIFVFLVSFSVMIYGLCHLSFKEIRSVFILALLAPLFKYVLKFAISPFIDGIPSIDTLILDIYSMSVSCLFEMLQFVVVILLINNTARLYREKRITVLKAAQMLGTDRAPENVTLIPFKKLFSKNNPLQVGALISAVVITGARVATLAISDIHRGWKITGINQYINFFSAYVVELTIGVIGYFLMLYFFIVIYSKLKTKAEA